MRDTMHVVQLIQVAAQKNAGNFHFGYLFAVQSQVKRASVPIRFDFQANRWNPCRCRQAQGSVSLSTSGVEQKVSFASEAGIFDKAIDNGLLRLGCGCPVDCSSFSASTPTPKAVALTTKLRMDGVNLPESVVV